jgi:hypothetical protein
MCALAWAPGARTQESKRLSAIPRDLNFAGAWDCAGKFRNDKVHKAAFSGSVILGGTWLELTEQDLEPATGYMAKYLIGYNAEQKRLVEFDANNFSAATYTSAEGWQNRVLIMTSEIKLDAKARYAANRFRYSITDKDTFTVDWETSKTATLPWLPSDHLVCKRKAKE